jgi:hypothetical protein
MTDELVPQEPFVITPELQAAMDTARERAVIDAAPELTFVEPQGEPFVTTPELQAAIDAALAAVLTRSYSGRNPALGKMVNCAVCRSRHREMGAKCEQVFTHRVDHDNYELLKENDKGELVPDYRTCAKEGERPTMKQLVGAAAFKKKRFHPHNGAARQLRKERRAAYLIKRKGLL